ncbi:MAG: hypothetical protein WDL87_07895 [Candidatus Omnitrophota bacterium]|jgi:hypothetical protein
MNKKGVITIEFCMLIILCAVSGICMMGYLKGAIAGGWHANADSFSDDQYDDASSTLNYTKTEGPTVTITDVMTAKTAGGTSLSEGANDDGMIIYSNWGSAGAY